ncbi:MAG: hypothetical protein H6926_07705 [Chromatiales bacterium]|nr:hypothetical protein [Gammaproteobacteria bacterium]MCP5353053.1 hypothetical protein [Chromatiales bacterium]
MPRLLAALSGHGRGHLHQEALHSSGPLAALAKALDQPPARPYPATGADDGVRILAPLLAG